MVRSEQFSENCRAAFVISFISEKSTLRVFSISAVLPFRGEDFLNFFWIPSAWIGWQWRWIFFASLMMIITILAGVGGLKNRKKRKEDGRTNETSTGRVRTRGVSGRFADRFVSRLASSPVGRTECVRMDGRGNVSRMLDRPQRSGVAEVNEWLGSNNKRYQQTRGLKSDSQLSVRLT